MESYSEAPKFLPELALFKEVCHYNITNSLDYHLLECAVALCTCRIDRDISDANTKVYGDGSFKIFFYGLVVIWEPR